MKNVINYLFLFLLAASLSAQDTNCSLERTVELEKKLIQYYLAKVNHTAIADLIDKPICSCAHSKSNNACSGKELRSNLTLLATRSSHDYNTMPKNRIILETLYKIRSLDKDVSETEEELSQLLCTAIAYQELHEIIHDKMMKLYDWNEFYTYVEMLEVEWNIYKRKANSLTKSDKNLVPRVKLTEAIQNFDECLSSFKETLPATSHRNKFEAPCDEMEVALSALLNIYYTANHQEI